jgi:hypothetical protein
MNHRLLNLLTALSLLLCVAARALWVRSYGESNYVSRPRLLSSDSLTVTTRVLQVA